MGYGIMRIVSNNWGTKDNEGHHGLSSQEFHSARNAFTDISGAIGH